MLNAVFMFWYCVIVYCGVYALLFGGNKGNNNNSNRPLYSSAAATSTEESMRDSSDTNTISTHIEQDSILSTFTELGEKQYGVALPFPTVYLKASAVGVNSGKSSITNSNQRGAN